MYKSSIYQHMIAYVYNNGQFIFQMSSFAEAKPSVAAPAAPAAPAAAAAEARILGFDQKTANR